MGIEMIILTGDNEKLLEQLHYSLELKGILPVYYHMKKPE